MSFTQIAKEIFIIIQCHLRSKPKSRIQIYLPLLSPNEIYFRQTTQLPLNDCNMQASANQQSLCNPIGSTAKSIWLIVQTNHIHEKVTGGQIKFEHKESKQALLEAQEKKNLFLDSQGKMMFQVPLYSFCTAESNYLQKNSL